MFHDAVLKIEGNNVSCIEVNCVLEELMEQIENRLEQKFIQLIVNSLLNGLEESNSGIKQKFHMEASNFHAISLAYLNEWTKHTIYFNNISFIKKKFRLARCSKNC